jgi:hypothetical protein
MPRLIYLLLLIVLTLGVTQPASAHGEEPRLEIGSEVLAPGSVLEIRGVGFEIDEEISLSLRDSSNEISIGTVTGDVEGSFQLNFPLPADLSEGSYMLWARTDDHEVGSTAFTVRGLAVAIDSGEEPRSEEDGLLAALPTLPAGYSSTPLPQMEAAAEIKPEPEYKGRLIPWALGFLAVLSILLTFGLRRRGRA